MQDLTSDGRIKSVAQLMMDLEAEIAAIKDGTLKDAEAKHVLRARGLQIRIADLSLQAYRLDFRNKTRLASVLGLLEPPKQESEKRPQPEATA